MGNMNTPRQPEALPDVPDFTPCGPMDGDWMDLQYELYTPRANIAWTRSRIAQSWRPGDADGTEVTD